MTPSRAVRIERVARVLRGAAVFTAADMEAACAEREAEVLQRVIEIVERVQVADVVRDDTLESGIRHIPRSSITFQTEVVALLCAMGGPA